MIIQGIPFSIDVRLNRKKKEIVRINEFFLLNIVLDETINELSDMNLDGCAI